MAKNLSQISGSEQLYTLVRIALMQQGTSVNAVCKTLNLHHQAARAALRGERDGPKSRALREKFVALAGVR